MPLALQSAADEYLGWLQLEANRNTNNVRAYSAEVRRLLGFLAGTPRASSFMCTFYVHLRGDLARKSKAPPGGVIGSASAPPEYEGASGHGALACGARGSKFDSCQAHQYHLHPGGF